MKLLIPALIAGLVMCGSAQADAMKEVLEADRRMHERLNESYSEDARLKRAQRRLAESQLRREDSQQMRDDLIIMESMQRQHQL